MTKSEWDIFCRFKYEYKTECLRLLSLFGYTYAEPSLLTETQKKTVMLSHNIDLAQLQYLAAKTDGTPDYPIETPVVYNHSWDDIKESGTVKLMIVGDNPGKNEQLHKNQRYLVGQAGKIADGFFYNNPELKINFRQDVMILNKTPIHSAKTKQLGYIRKRLGESELSSVFDDSQIFTAQKTFELQNKLNCPIWIVGYGELRNQGLFSAYANEIKRLYANIKSPQVYLFQHFSMNRFIIDYRANRDEKKSVKENLEELGIKHRNEILGF